MVDRKVKLLTSLLAALGVMFVASVAFAAEGAGDNEYTMKAFIAIAEALRNRLAEAG